MNRNFKIMGIYAGLLCFVSILLILIASFSNTKIDPSYEVNNNIGQSIVQLTETNKKLNDEVNNLKNTLNEKEKIINNYKSLYNDDVLLLHNSMIYYIEEKFDESKKELEKININNLNSNNKEIYDNLIKKLN